MPSFKAQDLLIEENLETKEEPRMTKVNGLLTEKHRVWLVDLIKQFMDYFAWDNCEVFGLLKKLVDHQLSIKEGFKPYK